MSGDRGGPLDKLSGAALTLLLSALALYVAVQLVAAVWWQIGLGVLVAGAGLAAVSWWRSRRGGWD